MSVSKAWISLHSTGMHEQQAVAKSICWWKQGMKSNCRIRGATRNDATFWWMFVKFSGRIHGGRKQRNFTNLSNHLYGTSVSKKWMNFMWVEFLFRNPGKGEIALLKFVNDHRQEDEVVQVLPKACQWMTNKSRLSKPDCVVEDIFYRNPRIQSSRTNNNFWIGWALKISILFFRYLHIKKIYKD
jgi:hypothetical protein